MQRLYGVGVEAGGGVGVAGVSVVFQEVLVGYIVQVGMGVREESRWAWGYRWG